MKNEPVIGVFRECTACGFRYAEAPLQTPAADRCPRCGGYAGVAAVVRAAATANPPPEPPRTRLAVLLDNIRSAYNVGSAFRTADGAGVEHLYLTGITPAPPHRGISKTALGAERSVSWSHHPNSLRLVADLQAQGWVLWAVETAPAAVPLAKVLKSPLPDRLLLALGNEIAGVDPGLLAMADAVVALPMAGRKRSLNVATALAAVVYGLRLGGELRGAEEAQKGATTTPGNYSAARK